jgi:bacterioferritin-associated ferredoxin
VESIRVTTHACEQAVARFADEFKDVAHAQACGRICAEVGAAIRAGRMATRRPRFAVGRERPSRNDVRYLGKSGRAQSHRYVWTADERRLYLVARKPSVTEVITVIGPFVGEVTA